jgi:hypothetical protein
MSEQPNATEPKSSPVPCAECGSTMHTTGHHEGGAPAERTTDGGMSPMGHHEGGITAETKRGGMSPTGHHEGGITAEAAANGATEDDEKKPAGVAGGHHEGGSPTRK